MFGARAATILLLTVALAAFTFGCATDDDGGGAAGDGGSGGGGGGSGGGGGGGGMMGPIDIAFEASLHNTRNGQSFWYSEANNGFETLTNVAYDRLTCQDCHNKEDPAWAENGSIPSCFDCHDSNGGGGTGGTAIPKHLDSKTCLGCHGRQANEAKNIQARDVHSAFNCAQCHGNRSDDEDVVDANDVHGTLGGVDYDTMLQPGAIMAQCGDCHEPGSGGTGGTGVPPIPDNTYHGALHANVDCALCHTETVISCINCHLEDDLDNRIKCASGQVFDWKFVMKWDKGDGNEVYHPGTIMTVKYDCDRPQTDPPFPACGGDANDDVKSIAVFAPYYAHTVTEQAMMNILNTPGDPNAPAPGNSDGCAYCHSTENCDDITGADMNNRFPLIEFEGTGGAGGTGGPTGKLVNRMSGLIPLPPDYDQRFSIDFVEWQAGPGTGCPTEMPPEKPLVKAETGPDMWQTGVDTALDKPREAGAPLNTSEFQKFCPPN